MEYLLKVSAVIIIFYLCYQVFLQRDTFFEQNRRFLLIGLFTAFAIPFFVIPIYIEYTPAKVAVPNFDFSNVAVTETTEKPFDILEYLPMVYLLGIIFFSVRFLIQLMSLFAIIFKNKRVKKEDYTFVETNTNISPFSFFNWIVYNPNQFNEDELAQIIAHEKIHAQQLHSIDILVSQMVCVVLWFNPFIWFYNKSVKQNLEFIADQKAQHQFKCKKSYQTTLLKTSMPSHQMALSNNFYNSLIKKRIVMLHKSKSKKINLLKYALVLPVLAGFLMSFNTEEVYVEKQNPNNINKTDNTNIEVTIDKNTTDEELELYKTKFKKACDSDLYCYNLERNNKGEIISLDTKLETKPSGNVKTYAKNKNGISPFRIYYNKKNDEFGTYQVSGITYNFSKKIKNEVEEFIIQNNFTNERFAEFNNNLKSKGYDFDLKEIKRNSENQISSIHFTIHKNGAKGNYRIASGMALETILIQYNKDENKFIINKLGFTESLKDYKSDETIKVVIDKNTTPENFESKKRFLKEKYDLDSDFEVLDKNEKKDIKTYSFSIGKGKRIEKITTTNDMPRVFIYNSKTNSITSYTINKNGDPEYGNTFNLNQQHSDIILSKYTDESLKNIQDRLKKKNISAEFSDVKRNQDGQITGIKINAKSKTGIIINYNSQTDKTITPIAISYYSDGNGLKIGPSQFSTKENILKTSKVKLDDNMLYIIDGNETNKKEFEKLSPDDIESISVLTDEIAIKKYGNKGKNGVVEITTKK